MDDTFLPVFLNSRMKQYRSSGRASTADGLRARRSTNPILRQSHPRCVSTGGELRARRPTNHHRTPRVDEGEGLSIRDFPTTCYKCFCMLPEQRLG